MSGELLNQATLREKNLKLSSSVYFSDSDKKIKELAMILEEIIERFGENEDAQVKFAIRYDKNKTISKVFQLFAVLFGYEKK